MYAKITSSPVFSKKKNATGFGRHSHTTSTVGTNFNASFSHSKNEVIYHDGGGGIL